MTTQPKEVFLSYGREQEVQAFVLRLKHDLERNGFSVWLDLEDIPAGKPARRYVRKRLCFDVPPYVSLSIQGCSIPKPTRLFIR